MNTEQSTLTHDAELLHRVARKLLEEAECADLSKAAGIRFAADYVRDIARHAETPDDRVLELVAAHCAPEDAGPNDQAIPPSKIESTEWAKWFKAECPTSYADAIKLAEQVDYVAIEQRDDLSGKDDFLWAIIPECNTDFWLDALPTKNEALAVCREMKWRVRR